MTEETANKTIFSAENVGNMEWWTILKGLAFEGGPSSTKWVYLAMNFVLASVLIALTTSVCFVYMHSSDHHVDGGLLTAVVTIVGIVSACATNALNHRRTLNAQIATGQNPVAIADTPVTEAQPAS